MSHGETPTHPDPSRTPRSLYIHVPFCRHRCGYCNFSLVAGRDYLIERYLQALARELEESAAEGTLETLYLGGGTPTHLSDFQLEQLFATLCRRFQWNAQTEVTIEANPIDLQQDRSLAFREFGINRLSLGVQSFREDKLALLERDHTRPQIAKSVEQGRRFADSVSIDLIFATPGETLEGWRDELRQCRELAVDHVSTYELTYEKGTRFWTRRLKGMQQEAAEEQRLLMYEEAVVFFRANGLEQYEISSFARPGFRSRHNQVYWSGADYWALGPGASGFLQGTRYTNASSLMKYLRAIETGTSPREFVEQLGPLESARELLAVGLRRLEGVREANFQERTRYSFVACAGEALTRLLEWKLLEYFPEGIRLTPRGTLLYDTVAVEILNG